MNSLPRNFSPVSREIFLVLHRNRVNLQTAKLFIVTSTTKGVAVTTILTFSVWFKILYRVIRLLIQHWLLSRMVYLSLKYVIAIRNYEFFYYRH